MDYKQSITKFIEILIQSEDVHGLIISAKGGLGKTTTVLETLQTMGLVEDEHFIYVSGHVTPLKFFRLLSKGNILEFPRIIIADDIDNLIANKTSLALLKSALSEARGKRIVIYESRGIEDSQFDFTGKMIILTNNLSNNKQLQPLMDRCIVYDFETDPVALHNYIEKHIDDFGGNLSIEEKQSVWDKVARFIDSPNFSLRMLNKAFSFYKADKDDWYSLFLKSIKHK